MLDAIGAIANHATGMIPGGGPGETPIAGWPSVLDVSKANCEIELPTVENAGRGGPPPICLRRRPI